MHRVRICKGRTTYMPTLDHLQRSFQCGRLVLKNRITAAPIFTGLEFKPNLSELTKFYVHLAEDGVSMVTICAGLVHSSGAPSDIWHVFNEDIDVPRHRALTNKLQEHSCGEIARHMNATGFPSPMAYRYRKGLVHQEKFADSEWKTSTVKCLLKNPMYTGDMVQGKKRRYLAGGKKKTEICPPEDYVVVPNRHAPLVAREDFERVQKLLELEVSENRKKRNTKRWT